MLPLGPAIKVTIYLNRDTAAAQGFLHDEILEFLRRHGVQGASAVWADVGFGSHHRLHTAGEGDVAGLHLPIIIWFIEQAAKFAAIRSDLLALVTDGLVEAHPTEILKNTSAAGKVIS
jgi:hypothetical protein